MFYEWPAEAGAIGPEEELVRLVTSFATETGEVERFLGFGAEQWFGVLKTG